MLKSVLKLPLLLTLLLGGFGPALFAQSNCMQIGVGLEGSAYWSNGENPFIDQMKFSGGWISFNATGSSPWDTQLDQEIPLDADGYPSTGIPYPTSGGSQKVRHLISADNRVALGQYVFLYDGIGALSFYGIAVDSMQPGRMVVTVTGTGNVWMHLDSSAMAPNHLRNFRLVPYAEEATYEADIFRANFLTRADDFHALRFMDWWHTNNNPLQSWADRSTPTSYSQADSAGICYEYAIALSNRLDKTPWINIPHLADSNFIVEMAALWKDSLDPGLDLIVEYSNEVWNFQFQQTQWLQQNTGSYPAHWPANPHFDPNENWAWNNGRRQAWAINLFRSAWGADSNRVHRVLGTQSVNPWVTQNAVRGADRQYDFISPTWYFGISPKQAAAFSAGTTPEQVIDSCRAGFYSNLDNYRAHYTISDTTGGDGVIYYEGGQHISAYGNGNNPALQAFYDAQVHPNMYQLYDDVLDSLRGWGGQLAVAFVMGGDDSRYGSWGHIKSVDSVPSMAYSPKYMALLDNRPLQTVAFSASINLLQVDFTDQSGTGASTWEWDFGDGSQSSMMNPSHAYASPGTYQVCLTATGSNGCALQHCTTISVVAVGISAPDNSSWQVFPNPSNTTCFLTSPLAFTGETHLQILDLNGKIIQERSLVWDAGQRFSLPLTEFTSGIYLLQVTTSTGIWTTKLLRH